MIYLHQHNLAKVLAFAEQTAEQFDDVVVVTARSKFVDIAYQAAADMIYTQGLALSTHAVNTIAAEIISRNKLAVREHVEVNEAGITVCINTESTDGDEVVWWALRRVASALDTLGGAYGVVSYSDDITFQLSQVKSLMNLS